VVEDQKRLNPNPPKRDSPFEAGGEKKGEKRVVLIHLKNSPAFRERGLSETLEQLLVIVTKRIKSF